MTEWIIWCHDHEDWELHDDDMKFCHHWEMWEVYDGDRM